jgi:hypothetical protein
MGNYDINTDSDNAYVSKLGGRTYMAGVSPWFFTVSSPRTLSILFYRVHTFSPHTSIMAQTPTTKTSSTVPMTGSSPSDSNS